MTRISKRWSVLIWALVALLLCYIDRIIISLAIIEMKPEFGWDDSAKGTILSAFFVGYLVMQVLGGLLANKFGGRNVFLWAVLIWSAFTIATPFAAYSSFSMLVFARFIVGFGEGAAFPAVYSLIGNWMRKDEVTRSIGFMSAASTIGTIFALIVAGLMIKSYGWTSVFYIFGSLGFVWALFWLWKVPKKAIISEDRLQDLVSSPKSAIPWKILLTHPAVLCLYAVAMAGAMISYTLVTWMPSFYVDTFKLSIAQASFYTLPPVVVITFTSIAAGVIGDSLIKRGTDLLKVRKGLTYFGFFFSGLFLVLLTQASSLIPAVICLSLSFGALGVAVPGYSAIPSELMPKHGEILYGFIAGAGSLASIPVVKLTGVILDKTGSYNLTFLFMAFGAAVGLVIFAIFARNDPIYQ